MRLKIVMCEGAHDIGFITKILLANGYKSYDKRIKEFPNPLNKYIQKNMSKEQVGDKKLGFSSSCYVPYASYVGNGSLLLFHNMGGDKTIEERFTLIDEYIDIMDGIKSRTIPGDSEIEDADYYMFFDSDELGVEGRVEKVRETFAEKYSIDPDKIIQGEKAEGGAISFGIYVFHNEEDSEKKGTLEDQIISLFRVNNKELISKAQEYLTQNKLDDNRTKEYFVDKEKYKGSSKFDLNKSIISVAGQLQFSGMSNSVIISRSDYITKLSICEDLECKKILKLLER